VSKTINTIRNYSIMICSHPLFVFSVNPGANMVFLNISLPYLYFPIIEPVFSLLWGSLASFLASLVL